VHNLGVVPVIMHLHRNRVGEWAGRSGLAPLIPYVDSATRSFTNMQFAQEAHGIPRMWMAGVGRGDFVDADGKPIPMFEAYFDAIHMLRDKDAKVGQLSAADLKNFETAISIAAKQASSVTKMPPDYFGISTTNPAGEGAIRASEARLIRSVEAQNTQMGVSLGWVGALALRFATGEWVQGNRIKVEWFDPATPTVAQRMDAIAKAKAQGILSREGAWDELGWSEARKNREREYFEREESAVLAADLSFLNKPVPDGAADSPAGD
ncbi:MAG TPA: phage portal protein, partial [Jiangellaceae bacterium]|nr:phage portal protein [Jiangellaceae bacterium]